MATKTNDILTSPSPTVKDKLLPRQYTEQQMEMIDELRTVRGPVYTFFQL